MNKTELAEVVATKTGLDKRQAEAAVSAVTETIIAEIKSGNRVSIFGFGSFAPKAMAARTARNPQTQETVKVPARRSVGFKVASGFKASLNTKGRKAAPAAKAPAKRAAPAKATAAKASATKAGVAKAPAKKAVVAKATKATKKR